MAKPKTMMETGRVVHLPVLSIRPNPSQPRKIFDPAGLQELAASILQYGVLQPLTVRRRESGYELVAGERRLRAARLAGLTEGPCIVMVRVLLLKLAPSAPLMSVTVAPPLLFSA